MRDAGHRTPDNGHRTAEKAKIIYPPPRGVDIISRQCARKSALDCKGSLQTSIDVSILSVFCTLFVRCR